MAKNDNLERSVRNYNAHFTRANLFVELANRTEQGLSSTLFLIATIFLGLTSPLVSDVQGLPEGLKVVLFISWIFTIVSILAGLVQIGINLRFFEWQFKLSNDQEATWAEMPSIDEDFKKAVRVSDVRSAESPMQTTFVPLTTQAVTMVIAILLAMIVGGLALFKGSHGVTQTECQRHIMVINAGRTSGLNHRQTGYYDKVRQCH